MLPAGFTIVPDDHAPIIRAHLTGSWDQSVLLRFEKELKDAVRRLRASGTSSGHALLLIDGRDHGVQPLEIVEGLQRLAQGLEGAGARTAAIVKSALHTMQARRINDSDQHRVFASEDEARAWLLG